MSRTDSARGALSSTPSRRLFTIGHSTLSIEAFCTRLTDEGIVTLADIRSIPGSNRNPQFNAERLDRSLASLGVTYVHIGDLGGRRNRQRDVDEARNAGWHNRSFRNYADYAMTPAFAHGLSELLALDGPIAFMCSEALPWRCHRTIVSDHLVARDHPVTHLISSTAREHVLGAWGPAPHLEGPQVTYPGQEGSQSLPLDL